MWIIGPLTPADHLVDEPGFGRLELRRLEGVC